MKTPLDEKLPVSEIKTRFDKDVERFTNLETGQIATIDAPLAMELITKAAYASTKNIKRVLDIGCGGGNNTLKLLQYVPVFDCDLIDLSMPMLEKAKERVSSVNSGKVKTFQGDFREVELPEENYDVILAAAVLHHLRDDKDWEAVFEKIFRLTAPGGSVWITDLVFQETEPIQSLMMNRYGEYLTSIGGDEYRDNIFKNIDREDSSRSVIYQLDLLRKVGFKQVEILHKNSCYAAFGTIKNINEE